MMDESSSRGDDGGRGEGRFLTRSLLAGRSSGLDLGLKRHNSSWSCSHRQTVLRFKVGLPKEQAVELDPSFPTSSNRKVDSPLC